MRILLGKAPGAPQDLRLRTRDHPLPGPGQVRLVMRCDGINFPDTLIIEDRYQLKPTRPFAPGAELCGTVDRLSEGVQGLALGDRVMALPIWGALAEKACVAANLCQKVPDAVTDAEAASPQVIYGTALYALEERGALRPGETVLVLGAAGCVGFAAVELAKVLGARVAAAVRSQDKLDTALDHGADAGIIYDKGPLDRDAQKVLNGQLRAALGQNGADIGLDDFGGEYSEPALHGLGRAVPCRRLSGRHRQNSGQSGLAEILRHPGHLLGGGGRARPCRPPPRDGASDATVCDRSDQAAHPRHLSAGRRHRRHRRPVRAQCDGQSRRHALNLHGSNDGQKPRNKIACHGTCTHKKQKTTRPDLRSFWVC